jgi:hypothetical protein
MARQQQLRAVGPDEKPVVKAKPKTLTEAIETGTYLEILEAQRRAIVRALPEAQGPASAALHRQLSLLSKEIETLTIVSDSESVVAETPDAPFDYAEI